MSVLLEKKEKTEITTGFFRFEFLRVVYRYVKNWHGQIPVHRTCNQEGLGSSHPEIFSAEVSHLLSQLKFLPSFALIVLFTLHLCLISSTLLLLHSVWKTNIIYSTSKNFDLVFAYYFCFC